ncbi:hypothetical protein AX768_09175 [Burkholderia sp. PAMC 28687]|uniref:hypothetical protein n=1 Tax=Burkholderia sp. PAMC 28687 TaxID=1795874 RepID=UPI0007841BB5|nr:hypothetical protein [Burkholderia sp. PAMC 28687]AMM14240.1 hypothetical protein AX768_09175 [Burkholderia sp. PAMC 28687]
MCATRVVGGTKLDAALARYLDGATKTMRAGILEGSRYPDGMPTAMVAFWNEYGTTRTVDGHTIVTPPRPFMRSTAAAKAERWAKIVGVTLQRNGGNFEEALKLAGEAAMTDIKQTIGTFSTPPNAASTIAKKGHDQPLRDTKNMLNSVAYDLVDGPVSEE